MRKRSCPSLETRNELCGLYNEIVDKETRNRIRLALAAYAYEIKNDPIMSDAEFDKLALEIDTTINTRRPDLDEFFRNEFSPHTGMWIYKHPDDLEKLYKRYRGLK